MRPLTVLIGLAASLAVMASPLADRDTGGYWYEKIKHNGINTGTTNSKYLVYRNVRDFGAKGDGTTDDSAAIQKAINTVDGSTGTRSGGASLTGAPAVIYFPSGTYLLNAGLKNIMGTVLMGDPTNRPVLKAGSGFRDAVLLAGQATGSVGLVAFFYEIKNLVLDSTVVAPTKAITLLQYSVSQACQLSNVMFNMPVGAGGHTGIATAGQIMPLLMNEVSIFGGGVGYSANALQLHLKNWYFQGMFSFAHGAVSQLTGPLADVGTGIKVSDTLTQATFQGLRFERCTIAIDATSGGSGHLSILDSSAADTPTFLLAATTTTATNLQGSLVLENVIVDASVAVVSVLNILSPTNTHPADNLYLDGQNRHHHRTQRLHHLRNHLDSRQCLQRHCLHLFPVALQWPETYHLPARRARQQHRSVPHHHAPHV